MDCQLANVHYNERLLCFVTLRARAEQTKTENKYIKVKIYWQKMAEKAGFQFVQADDDGDSRTDRSSDFTMAFFYTFWTT